MARFRYRAVERASGQVKAGIVDGASLAEATDTLRRTGLVPVEALRSTGGGTPARRRRLTRGLAPALHEFAALLGAGLPLDRALQVVAECASEPALRAAFAQLRQQVKDGAPLSAAFERETPLFPPLAAALATAGEAAGALGPAMARLADTVDRAETLGRTIRSALLYPAVLLVVALGASLVILLFVVPEFESLFADVGDRLPPATAFIVAASRLVRDHGLHALLAVPVAALAIQYLLRQPGARAGLDRLAITLPLFGRLIAGTETARFARTLGNLVTGGVSLPQALAIAVKAVGNRHMAAALARAAADLKEGGGLSGPLSRSGVLPPLAQSFIRTGEETAQLGPMTIQLADVLERDVRIATQRLIDIMTPLMTVILGLFVAGVMVALLSGILSLNDLAMEP